MNRFFRTLWGYYRSYKLYTSIFIAAVIFDLAVVSFVALSFKFLLDNAIKGKNETVMIWVIALLVLTTVLSKIGYVVRSYLYAHVRTGITKDLRIKLFRCLQQRSTEYFRQAKTGDVLSHFSSDIASVEGLTYMAVPNGLGALVGIVINLTVVFILEWKLALLSLIGLLLCAAGPLFFSAKASRLNDSEKKLQADLLSQVEESVGVQQVIKAFALEESGSIGFARDASALSKVSAQASFYNDLLKITPNIIIETVNVLIICAGAVMAFYGYITPGTLVSFNGVFVGLSTAVGNLTWVFPLIMQSSASIRRLESFMEAAAQDDWASGGLAVEALGDGIGFDNVSFGYSPDALCLRDVNLHIPKGAAVAIVGASGSGKSTVANLILGLYQAQMGRVTVGGRDVKDIDPHSLRQISTVVLQESVLFNTSIMENFRRIRPTATEAQILEAAKSAQVHAMIEGLPLGYATIVGERGKLLSAGRRQQIALALALLRKPELLILDEATSALDPNTEKDINHAIMGYAGAATVLNITNRVENIRDYDVIYVMANGRIIEQGTHHGLIGENGVYADLCRKQSGFVISEDLSYAEIEEERLSKIDIFKYLTAEELPALKAAFQSEYYREGETIIRCGEQGDRFYVIARGKVEVIAAEPGSTERVVAVLEDGDYFGEIALLKSVVRTATIRAKVPCIVLSLKRQQFDLVLNNAPELKEALLSKMASRLSELNKNMIKYDERDTH